MDKLSYKLIIDKINKRHVDLLHLMLESNKPILLTTLMNYCKVSMRTIKSDFEFFKEMFPDNIYFTKYHGHLAIELIGTLDPIEEYQKSLIENNPLFLVIENSFFSEHETVDSLAEELFISSSTLRKYLNHLKNVLSDYDLSLNLNPIQITGNEFNIRFFYFSYFEQHPEARKLNVLSAEKTAYNTISLLTERFKKILTIDYHRLTNWQIIVEHRLAQKRYVHFDETVYLNYCNDQAFIMLHEALQETFSEHILGELNKHEMLYSYLIILDTVLYDKEAYFFVNDFFERLIVFEPMTTAFFKESNLPFSSHMELKTMLQAFLANLTALTDLTPLFQKNDAQLTIFAKEKYPEIMNRWLSLLNIYSTFVYKEEVAVSLTILTIANIKRNKRVLLSLSGTPATINYYKILVEKLLPREVDLLCHSNQPLDNSLIKKMEIDLCIYNYKPEAPITFCKTVDISKMSLKSELEKPELTSYFYSL
ncbi:helix-turn-helix domain-containing protein [Enterococcus rivorum]|uniref:Mga helix-turn-helix domain-containing protein n=1 Tax=Enterococcus rivorum TaxID=762845 RepID=A0A1E5KXR1_9ENTE|nr:helix-turn-helix domain-containing protein [Enterococcus rivorum]MBP2099474.1 transcriptional antiterminator [Enterococcus rivorum]OEH82588.1 hypothetical protein BCR26_12655 [Enterococcus rivorum]